MLTFLEQMSKQSEHSAHVKKFKIMFKRFADQGHAGLTSEMFHQAGTVGKLTVMRFSSGSLRVYCFYDGPHIVLAHAALKKSQKTSDSDLNSAAAVEKKYNQGV
ncbi:type II toxin-antitoxin system RelE/ParE family toxin [Paenalcaligenes suwonensis]|uniref:type II toxin-antitoxin system RelE/ParE family toxin n=1 Tax=Paenalcaligenes suwonensis TaxID=1202713 RepID=UPI00140C2C6C|nr:type II toxin-antitoxin system RelE/ParE family toxin [Paenalcaligenes suwonensis]NHC62203.1 hypothetical protein [Paenalcaligenes suwonensis]